MGYEKYLVSREPKDIELQVEDEIIKIKARGIPWSLKNQFISQATSWDSDGKTHFDADLYVRSCLKHMIVEAPWGQTTDVFLSTIGDGPLGAALESIIPTAFGTDKKSPSAEQIKKE